MTAQPAVDKTGSPPVGPRTEGSTSPAHLVGAALAGTAVAGLVLWGRHTGVLEGALGLGLVSALVLLAPLSRTLSGRIVAAVALCLGWVPLLWWIPITAPFGRTTLLLAAVAGSLAAWLAAGWWRAHRQLLPRVGVVDLAPALTAIATTWLVWPILTATSGDRTLNLLIKSGWDHAAHFGMVQVMRSHGQISPFLGPSPDGSNWVGASYPQHFHATIATLVELLGGDNVRPPSTEVLAYGQALSLFMVICAIGVAAGVVQLRHLRTRPILALPLSALIVVAVCVGPGTVAFSAGWPNLVMAAVASSLAVLVAGSVREPSLLALATLGGLVLATAHSWVLMAPFAVVGGLTALTGTRLSLLHPAGARARTMVWATVLVTSTLTVMVIPILSSSGAGDALTEGGGAEFSPAYLLLALGAALVLGAAPLVDRSASWRQTDTWAVLATPLFAVAFLGTFAAYQLTSTGQLAYYFGKLAVGVTIVALASAAVGLDRYLSTRPGHPPGRREVGVALGLLGAVAASQTFGYVGPQPTTPFQGLSPMAGYRQVGEVLLGGPSGEAQRLLAAAEHTRSLSYGITTYVAGAPGDPIPVLADQWCQALSVTYSGDRQVTIEALDIGTATFSGPQQVAKVMNALIDQDARRVLLVDATLLEQVSTSLKPRTLRQSRTL